MLFLSFLFKISEREVERLANDSISFKQFLGLGLIDKAPDHSSLTNFKNRVLEYTERREQDLLKEIIDDVVILALEKGIQFGIIQAIDGTHTIADVNTQKERKRTKPIKDNGDGKPPRDPDAKWRVKRVVETKTITGQKVKINKSYYGYNNHLSQRFAVKRVNASLKKDGGLGRARYLGLTKMRLQTSMTCLSHNLKTLVKQLTGVGLRTFSTACLSGRQAHVS